MYTHKNLNYLMIHTYIAHLNIFNFVSRLNVMNKTEDIIRYTSIVLNSVKFILENNFRVPWTDFCPLLKSHISNLWHNQWNNLAPNYAPWYKNISPSIPSHPWFHNLKLNRNMITSFSRLRFGHTLLPSHSYKLSLNDSPLCMLHAHDPMICDISHILYHCPLLVPQRNSLFALIHSFNVPLDTQSILSSPIIPIITSLIFFFN
jgi:hypothetical protein